MGSYRRVIVGILFLPTFVLSQTEGDSRLLRSVWEEMADSLLAGIPESGIERVLLSVDAEREKSAIENVFIERLQRKGTTVLMRRDSARDGSSLLQVVARTIAETRNLMSWEARWETRDGVVRSLGSIERTVPLPETTIRDDRTMVERIIEPLVVVIGTVMIVYLFFTVRT